MSKTDNKNHIRNGIHRLCRQTSRLNLYVQNARLLNVARVAREMQEMSTQIKHLLKQINPKSKEEEMY